jgi:hypothetical protein
MYIVVVAGDKLTIYVTSTPLHLIYWLIGQ